MRVPKNEFKRSPQLKPWQVSLNRFFNRAWFELLIGALVLLSVSLTLFEFWLESELVFGKAKVLTPLGVLTRWHLDLLTQINDYICLLYTSPSPRDQRGSRMPSSA